jgi:pimeloyl-ACP methyl ester carboxylesterase
MEKFIIAAGTALRIADTEKGDRAVVLLHGYLENLDVWEAVTRFLQPSVRVIALDLPGHGISQVRGEVHTMDFLAEVVHEALIQVGVAKYTVVGHSMGGYVALALAARYPETLDGLVLFTSTPNADSPEKLLHREREIAIVEAGRKELLAKTLPAKGFSPANRTRMADEVEDYAELVILTEDEGITALLRGMMERPDMNDAMRALTIPQLFVFGRQDEYIPVEVAAEVATRHPQAAVRWLEVSGHNGHIEQPRELTEAILEFISTNDNKNRQI